jgi:hypothetical protein
MYELENGSGLFLDGRAVGRVAELTSAVTVCRNQALVETKVTARWTNRGLLIPVEKRGNEFIEGDSGLDGVRGGLEGLADNVEYSAGFAECARREDKGISVLIKEVRGIVGCHEAQRFLGEGCSLRLGKVALVAGKNSGFELDASVYHFGVCDNHVEAGIGIENG